MTRKNPGPLPVILQALLILFVTFRCHKNDETVVAEFNGQKITLEEFRLSYLDIVKQPGTFDSPELRENFLDELITRRILSTEAEAMGLHRDEKLKYRIEAYRNKCMRGAHYERVIRSQIHIDETDVAEAYLFTQEKRRIRHLFAETREQADSLYRLLKSGAPFDSLAAGVFHDPALSGNGGDLGWVDWSQLDYEMAMTSFRQKVNAYSEPVRSRWGYHIVQVTDTRKNPLITRQQYEAEKNKARALLENKIGDFRAQCMLETMMDDVKIQVFPRIMQAVGDQLALQLDRSPSAMDAMNEMQLSDAEVLKLQTSLWDMRREALARIDGKSFTVGEFISALTFVPYDAVVQSYRSALNFAFRDFVLTERAKAMHLDRDREVRLKTGLYREYMLQSGLRKRLVQNAAADTVEIRKAWDEARETRFRNMPFDSVKTYIGKELLKEKRREAVPRYIRNILAGTDVKLYPERIHEYYDAVYRKTDGNGR